MLKKKTTLLQIYKQQKTRKEKIKIGSDLLGFIFVCLEFEKK